MTGGRQPRRRPGKLKSHPLFFGLLDALRDPNVRVLLALTASFVGGAALVYSLLEGWGAIDSIYFATVTIATVGFGDFAPKTDAGKLFTIFYILVGMGLFVALATAVADRLIRRVRADLGVDEDGDGE